MINSAFCLALIDNEADKAAFDYMVRKYEKRLFHVANNILKNNSSAEEAVYEGFFRIAKCFQKVNNLNVHELEAYLIVTVRSVCYQMYNKEKNNKSDLSFDELIFEPHFEEANKYDYALLKAEIAGLEEKYKNVLVYTYFYGMNAEETASAMGVSRRTVYNYIKEARAILIEKLGDENDG
ncbi:MAG: sigma-70 family RNA polymerase sigma factor [Ruminococcus sp.]|nr:sigma-70 family RNA polymerase sigma factor [Ruminococcus sp.]